MKKCKIQLTYSASEDLDGLHDDQRKKIIAILKIFSTDPFTHGANIRKLKAFKPPIYRARSGDYRILYRVQENKIIIMRVIDRKDLDRVIKRLKLSKV